MVALAGMLAAVLVWWLVKNRDANTSTEVADEAANTQSRLGVADDRSTPPTLDLIGVPKAAISGTIRDPEGSPIPDAHVCASSDVEDRLGADDRMPHCVRSDRNGRYAIDDLLPIETEVHASAATFKPARWERRDRAGTRYQVRLRAGQTAKDIDITLEPGGVLIRGVVKDISGGEIEGARVAIGYAYVFSDGAGEFEQWVAPGEIAVVAEVEGYAIGWVLAVAPGQFIELFLTPESVLVGKVVLAEGGEPVEGAVITVGGRFNEWYTASTDSDGRFRIDRLQPGTYKPSAETASLYGQAAEQVHLGLGETSEELVIRVHSAAFVEGRVVIAGAEQPCTSGSVRLENPGVNSEYATLDDDGHVEFRGVLSGHYRVYVYCEGHISEDEYPDLVVANATIGGLEWEVREGLVIRGLVVDEAGESVGRIEVSARAVVDGDAARTQTTSSWHVSDSDGSFELAGLLPGRYELSTIGGFGSPGSPEPLVVELAHADVNDVRLVLPATGTVRGRVIDETGKPVENAQIGAWLVGGKGYGRSRSNDAGEFELAKLELGSTRITASDGEAWGAGSLMRKPGTTDDDVQGELVEVVANELVEVTLIVESRDGRITGVVKDEGGAPVVDAFVDVERMSDSAGASGAGARQSVRWSWGTEPVLTDIDGRFELMGLPDGKFIVRANRKGGGDAILESVALGSHVELVIASTNEISGTVKLADGGVPERFTIQIEDKGISLSDSYYRTNGVWRITEIPAGRFEIKVSAAEGSAILEGAIELGEGEARSDVELILQTRVTLRGRIVDVETREPVAGLWVYVSSHDAGRRPSDNEKRHISDADGRFEIEDVPIGKISLVVWNRSGGSKAKYDRQQQRPLVVAAEPLVQDIGELELVAKRLGPDEDPGDLGYRLNEWDPSIEPEDWKPIVASVRPDGPAAATELAAGDVIEKVDGVDVSGNFSRYYTLTQVPVGATVKLELAGGKTLALVAGPPLF